MSLKLDYHRNHLDFFPEDLGECSEEQGKRICQDIKTMQERYQGLWDAYMIAEYRWTLKRDCLGKSNFWKSWKWRFCVLIIDKHMIVIEW